MDDDPDCGWMTGLPAGWVCAKIAVVRYCNRLAGRANGEDLEPQLTEGGWLVFPRRDEERDARAVAAFQSALLTGSMNASIFDGHDFKPLPKAAFIHRHVIDAGLRNGSIELDPLWPDEWRQWNGHVWAFSKDHFDAWLSSDGAFHAEAMPPVASLSDNEMVAILPVREPSDRNRVPLSEAVSWIAFGLALDADRLKDATRWDRLAGGDLQEAQRKVAAAVEALLDAGADEKIAFHGRHTSDKHANIATTAKIEPHQCGPACKRYPVSGVIGVQKGTTIPMG